MRGFSSDTIRNIVAAAVKQDFVMTRGNRHVYLHCPKCPWFDTVSTTAKSRGRNGYNHVAILRRHGLEWQGRGGVHTAEIPDDFVPDKMKGR